MRRKYTEAIPYTELTVADGNFDPESARNPIDRVVLHTTVGTVAGAAARFGTVQPDPNKKASANYLVGLDGQLYAFLEEYNVAFANGDYAMNQRAISIEHEDGYNPQTNPTAYDKPRPDILYVTSAKLVADICDFYNIPIDRDHVIKHSEVPYPTHCPGTLDVEKIVRDARAISDAKKNNSATPPVKNPDEKPVNPVPSDGQITIDKSLFEQLVTTSTSNKEIAQELGFSEQDYLVPGFSKKVLDLVATLRKIDNDQTTEINDMKKAAKAMPTVTVEKSDSSNNGQAVTKPVDPSVTLSNQPVHFYDKDLIPLLVSVFNSVFRRARNGKS